MKSPKNSMLYEKYLNTKFSDQNYKSSNDFFKKLYHHDKIKQKLDLITQGNQELFYNYLNLSKLEKLLILIIITILISKIHLFSIIQKLLN